MEKRALMNAKNLSVPLKDTEMDCAAFGSGNSIQTAGTGELYSLGCHMYIFGYARLGASEQFGKVTECIGFGRAFCENTYYGAYSFRTFHYCFSFSFVFLYQKNN